MDRQKQKWLAHPSRYATQQQVRERQEPRYYSPNERCGCVSYEEQGWCRHTAGADRARYGFG